LEVYLLQKEVEEVAHPVVIMEDVEVVLELQEQQAQPK
jgi:hypothetical protein